MPSFKQLIAYGLILFSAITIGYDSGYLNGVLGAEDFVQRYGTSSDDGGPKYLTPYTKSLFSSLLIVGTTLGCLITPMITNKIGRKGVLIVASCVYVAGVILQTAGLPPAAFVIGRVLLGGAIGFISNVVPAYLMECSTPTNRGPLMAWYLQFLTAGNVLACGINFGTSEYTDSRSWRVTITFQLFFAIVILFGSLLIPESPFYLLQRDRPHDARRSIATLLNADVDSNQVNEAMNEIEGHLADIVSHGDVKILECFQGTNRTRTFLGMAMSFFTIATGITFWFGYGTTFFMASGVDNSYLISLVLAITNCLFTAPSIYLIERFGRRWSLLVGGVIMALTQILTGVMHSASPDSTASKNMLVAGAIIFIAAYAPTWGIGGWIVMTEPFSNRLRITQTSLVLGFYWVITWLIGFVTPYLVDKTAADLGVNVAYIWFGIGLLSIIWAFFFVPELAGLSRAEVDILFEQHVPAWRSVAWKRSLRTLQGAAPLEIDGQNESLEEVKVIGADEKA